MDPCRLKAMTNSFHISIYKMFFLCVFFQNVCLASQDAIEVMLVSDRVSQGSPQ